jgi:hypothetical protein
MPMKLPVLFFTVFLVAATNAIAQNFTRSYGNILTDEGASVQETSDGGFIVAGVTENGSTGTQDIYLQKTNASGVVIWSKEIGGAHDEIAACVIQTSDGGYIIAGTNSFNGGPITISEGLLIKTDASGSITWQQTEDGTIDGFKAVTQTADGGYIVSGYYNNDNTSLHHAHLVKFDSQGNPWWVNAYGTNVESELNSVEQTADGGYIACGWTNGAAHDMYMLRVDNTGATLWSKIFSSGFRDANSVVQTADGGFIIAGRYSNGSTSKGAAIIKTDSDGNSTWSNVYGLGTTAFEAKDIYQLNDGSYNLVVNDNQASSGFTYFLKIDSTGMPIGGTKFLLPGNTLGMCIEPVSDGGIIIAGKNNTPTDPLPEVILIKAYSGDLPGCNQDAFSFSVTAQTSNVNDPGYPGVLVQCIIGVHNAFGALISITELSLCSGVGMDAPATNFTSNVYPNPFTGSVTIEMAGYTKNTAVLIITDVTGREVKREVVAVNNSQITWQRKDLANGAYAFRLEDDDANRIASGKLLLQ